MGNDRVAPPESVYGHIILYLIMLTGTLFPPLLESCGCE